MNILAASALTMALGAAGIARAEVEMHTVAAGGHSAIAAERTVVVRNEAEWQRLWREARIRKPIPEVDFGTRMIVGVFLGTRPTSGYSVRIVGARLVQGALVATYAESSPPPRAVVRQVQTSPFDLVSVPAHGGSVRFEQAQGPPAPFPRGAVPRTAE